MDDGDDPRADGKAEVHDAGVGGDERAGAGEKRRRVGEGKFADEIEVRLRVAAEMMVAAFGLDGFDDDGGDLVGALGHEPADL